ncbi:4422_t:CDS:1, partial [Gigaspora margarita]
AAPKNLGQNYRPELFGPSGCVDQLQYISLKSIYPISKSRTKYFFGTDSCLENLKRRKKLVI